MAAAQPAASLEDNIAAYDDMREELERTSFGKWVVFHNCQLIGSYCSFSEAADEAIESFADEDPYLIRQVRNYPDHLPVSVLIGGGRIANR